MKRFAIALMLAAAPAVPRRVGRAPWPVVHLPAPAGFSRPPDTPPPIA